MPPWNGLACLGRAAGRQLPRDGMRSPPGKHILRAWGVKIKRTYRSVGGHNFLSPTAGGSVFCLRRHCCDLAAAKTSGETNWWMVASFRFHCTPPNRTFTLHSVRFLHYLLPRATPPWRVGKTNERFCLIHTSLQPPVGGLRQWLRFRCIKVVANEVQQCWCWYLQNTKLLPLPNCNALQLVIAFNARIA